MVIIATGIVYGICRVKNVRFIIHTRTCFTAYGIRYGRRIRKGLTIIDPEVKCEFIIQGGMTDVDTGIYPGDLGAQHNPLLVSISHGSPVSCIVGTAKEGQVIILH